ncbi:unnamed protein product [Brachionus calyciflorus]|uniref:Reverse transcriptase domain-containing protein n=1 Tax=Brachionus calyciflorus TaxID=104777 RepID=A0A814FAY3_9BILA|nr:unnamed protein product [Brachionus calyciflorus]
MKEILMAEAVFKTAKDIEEKNDKLLREAFNFKSILNVYSRFDDKYLVHYLSDGSQIVLYTSMGNVYKLNCKSIKEVKVLANTKHRNSSNSFSIIKPISDIVPCNRIIQYIQLPSSDNTLKKLRHETYLVSDSQLQYTKIDYLGNKVKQTNFQHKQLLLDGVDLLSTFHDVANNEMSAGTCSNSSSSLNSENSSSSSIRSSNSMDCIAINTDTEEDSFEKIKEANTQFNTIEEAREVVALELKQISAKSVTELEATYNSDVAFEIEFMNPKQRPLRCKCRPLNNLKEKVRNEIELQIEAKIIRSSRSQWCSPIRGVDKPEGSIRITDDYKALNQLTKDDNYQLPSIQDLYNKLAEADTFTKIDMKTAYHQIAVHPNSIKITAFIFEFGNFDYLTMPMGIKTAPAWF